MEPNTHYQRVGKKSYEKYKEKYLQKQKDYYQNHGKHLKKAYYESRREQIMFQRYGILAEEYNDLIVNQGGVCKICGSLPPQNKKLDIDHCHSTGIVRGLLCNSCNRGLGYFKDNVNFLQKAQEYLNESTKNISGKGGSCGS